MPSARQPAHHRPLAANDTGVVLARTLADLDPDASVYAIQLRAIERIATVARPVDELTDAARDGLIDELTDLGSTRTVIDLTPRRGGHGHCVVTVALSDAQVVEEGARLGPALRRAVRATRRVSASPDRAGP